MQVKPKFSPRIWFVACNPQGVPIPQTSSNSRRGAIANVTLGGGKWSELEAQGYSVHKITVSPVEAP